eukprot:1159389-Pelagomonas_calceolata.AAC.10
MPARSGPSYHIFDGCPWPSTAPPVQHEPPGATMYARIKARVNNCLYVQGKEKSTGVTLYKGGFQPSKNCASKCLGI